LHTKSQTKYLKLITQKLKHLIFDLGGVIINLKVSRTIDSFARITGKTPQFIMEFALSHPAFQQYERGEIASGEFRDAIRSIGQAPLSDAAIDTAWNAMILDLPSERIDLLKTLRMKYDTYLLSNINDIHYKKLAEIRFENSIEPFDQLFVKDYYSHFMGMRKPDAEIFELVMAENNLKPEETLFLDDTLDNIKGAAKLGIKTLHVTSPHLIFEFFDGR
jgi:glucose-1-phosphatase